MWLTGAGAESVASHVLTHVLVVGAGFLGAHVTAELVASGATVKVLTRRPPYGDRAPCMAGAAVIVGDASDAAVVGAAIAGVDAVVYCAGGLRPAESDLDPLADLQLTLPPLLTVLDALRDRPGTRLVFLSSGGTVYGEPTVLPVPEWHSLAPSTSYGILKASAERYVDLYRDKFGVASVILRCANVYGEGQPSYRSQGVVATVVASALEGRPVVVFGDCSTVRDYVYVGDVARVVAALCERTELPTVLNVGSGTGTSLSELIELVSRIFGAVRVERQPMRPCDIHRSVLDISALRAVMTFDPVDLPIGLARVAAARASLSPSLD